MDLNLMALRQCDMLIKKPANVIVSGDTYLFGGGFITVESS